MKFKVNEIFTSLQGEGTRAGRICCFIRLTGCPLRCIYCDTEYAFYEGQMKELDEILNEVVKQIGTPKTEINAPFVELTGGEPLAHPHAAELLRQLLDIHYEVAIETAGSHDLSVVPTEVIKIVDRKTPGSGEVDQWLETNLNYLVPGRDELKFVLVNESDYDWARAWCLDRKILDRQIILFSPAWGSLDPQWLAEKIIQDKLPVRFQTQLHKVIWGSDRTGV
ncbi:7-carboxy-7-deazaguanine synthase [Acidobacteriota bacterium]|nr:7-carboxy-7-deazaguanine synthase [Acidobacteriota bacterium]